MDVFRVGRRDGEVMGREARIETHERVRVESGSDDGRVAPERRGVVIWRREWEYSRVGFDDERVFVRVSSGGWSSGEKRQRGVGWEFSRRRKLYWDVLRVAVAKGCKDDGAFRTVAQVESAPGRVRVEVFDFARREEFSDDE